MAGETRIVAGDGTGYYNCDGTDDHIQINLALAWAAANSGNTVYLKGPFTYDIKLELLIGSSTVFKGDSTAVLRLNNACMWASGVPVIGQYGGTGTVTTGVEISGFSIDCNESHLTHDGVGSPERIHGKGYYNAIYIQGRSTSHAADIHVHDLTIYNSMGDGVRIAYGTNIRVHDCTMYNLQHCSVFCVDSKEIKVYDNDIQAITCSGTRFDNCQNWYVYNNNIRDWTGTSSAPKGGAHGVQFGNQPASYGHTTLTQNGEIYNNTISVGACGIQCEDYYKKAGTSAQTVSIHNNRLTGCGWTNWDTYFAGIDVYSWGNGITISKNTIEGSFRAGILARGAITSGVKVTVKDNNITGTVKAGSAGGYGILNQVSTSLSVIATGNYTTNNVSGNYYKVTPSTTATKFIDDAIPDGRTDEDDDDPVVPDPIITGIYIPGSTSIIDDEYTEIERDVDDFSAYINYIPFLVMGFTGDGEKTIGESKSPTVAGSSLSDFNFRGANVTFDCIAFSVDDLSKVLAAFYSPGRSTIELGGPYKGYKITGVGVSHTTGWNFTKGDVPQDAHPYSLTFKVELPCMELIRKRTRGRYVYNSMQFSSDDIYAGNLIKNPSFENWTPNTSLDWNLQTPAATTSFECVRYSPELDQYCAVSSSGTDNRIAISDGTTWGIPTSLTTATNHDNEWNTLVWCPAWMLWCALSKSGLSGYGCITSSDGASWAEKATPSAVDSNAWECSLFIPPAMDRYLTTSNAFLIATSNDKILTVGNGSELALGRIIAFASSGSSRVMYSEDQCANWIFPASNAFVDAHDWISSAYSPELHRIVVVAYDGAVMYSDDYASTWTESTAPSQKWTDIKWVAALAVFMACSEDGDQQIMTSSTGLSGSWTLQTTPYISSVTYTTGSSVVRALNYVSPAGYNYTTKFTSYMLQYTFTLPALSYGHVYRIDNVGCRLRTLNSKYKAYCKVTVSSTSLGTDVLLKEWTETKTSYVSKSFDLAKESATNEVVTIKFWIKTSNASIKAGVDLMGYTASEMTVGGSTIGYIRPKLSGLEWADDWGLGVAISNDTTTNKTIYTTNGTSWSMGDSAAADAWSSMCTSDELGEFMAVSTDGTIMSCSGYGELEDIAPNSWVLENTGQSRSYDNVIDGLYAMKIIGDGVTKEPGLITQIISFDSNYDAGEYFVLSGQCTVTGLTTGSFKGDLYAGGTVIKEIVWSADTDGPIQKDITFKFDTVPSQIYVRVHGADTPNVGAECYFDDFVISKKSDLELAETGSDISTTGYYDVIPDVTIRGVGIEEASAATTKVISEVTPADETYSSKSTSYGNAVYSEVLPALTGGSKYRLNELSFSFKSSNLLSYTYLKVTLTAASLFGGKETDIAMYTTNKTTLQKRVYTLPYTLESDTNETVTLRYYIRVSRTGYQATSTLLGYKITEILDSVSTGATEIYLYNTADPRIIQKCCNALPKGYMAQIRANYMGSYRYVEPFEDDAYISNAYSITGTVARNSEHISLVMSSGSSIVFPFDCLYPVTGIPFIKLFVLSGIPQISIADDSGTGGIPGTFYPIYSNTSMALENAEIQRELDNINTLRLRGKTKYYVKIEPYAGASCEFCQMLEYASLDTMDAERPYIYSTGAANTFAVSVGGTGKCSAVVSLGYHDANILP
jgi:hypothetical protein